MGGACACVHRFVAQLSVAALLGPIVQRQAGRVDQLQEERAVAREEARSAVVAGERAKARGDNMRPEIAQVKTGARREVAAESKSASPACQAAASNRARLGHSNRFRQTAFLLAVFFIAPALQGCVTQSTLAKYIVNPGTEQTPALVMAKKLAQPFYSKVGQIRSRSDQGTILSYAIIEPRDYDFSINFTSNNNKSVISLFLYVRNLKSMGLDNEVLRTAATVTNPSNYIAHQLLPRWITRLPSSKPIGTVIMFPGYGDGKYSLLPGALLFAKLGWRVVIVDLRGQGHASAKYMTWGIRDREDIHRLQTNLDALGLIKRPVVYMGVSYGAGVALMAAAKTRSVSGVIAVAPWESASTVIPRFACWAAHVNWLMRRIVCHINPSEWREAERRAGIEAGVNLNLARPINDMPFIKSPVLLIGGGDDAVATPRTINHLARHGLNARVIILPKMGHFAVTSDVPALCLPITSWINSIARIKHASSVCHNISVEHPEHKYSARVVVTIVQHWHASVFDFLHVIF